MLDRSAHRTAAPLTEPPGHPCSRRVAGRLAGGVVAAGIGAATLAGVTGTANAELSQAQQDQILALHNQYRAEVGTPPVRWDGSLAAAAQAYANQLLAANSNAHSPTTLGESLASESNSDPNALHPTHAVTGWYAERQDFLNNRAMSNHYTQMVSSRVQRVGCGEARGPSGGLQKSVVVCQYDPNGNDGQPPF